MPARAGASGRLGVHPGGHRLSSRRVGVAPPPWPLVVFVVGCGQTAVPGGAVYPADPARPPPPPPSRRRQRHRAQLAATSPHLPVAELLPIAGSRASERSSPREDRTGLISDRTFNELFGRGRLPEGALRHHRVHHHPARTDLAREDHQLTRDARSLIRGRGPRDDRLPHGRGRPGRRRRHGEDRAAPLGRHGPACARPSSRASSRGDIELVITPTSVGESAGSKPRRRRSSSAGGARTSPFATRTAHPARPETPRCAYQCGSRSSARRSANATSHYFGVTGDTSPSSRSASRAVGRRPAD